MDFSLAINRNRRQLARIVATLFDMVGLVDGTPVERVNRSLYLASLRLLRPAESAVRRLIVVMARGLVVKLVAKRARPTQPIIPRKHESQRRSAFQLFDPRQHINARYCFRRHPMPVQQQRPVPRVRVIDVAFDPRIPLFRKKIAEPIEPPPATSEPDDTVSAVRLSRRLFAIKSALEDLPRQAKRYAKWQARPQDQRRPQRSSALRSGSPPGHRKRAVHKVDEILGECHWLARHARYPDTS